MTLIFLLTSLSANVALCIALVVMYQRKIAYKLAFRRNVVNCKRIMESGRRYKDLTGNLDDIFNKLRINAKEQSLLVDQANTIIGQEKELCKSMVEIDGDLILGLTPWNKTHHR